jgi:hypothetical protein
MITDLISPLSTYHLPSATIFTVPIPNLPVNVAEKALESLSSPPSYGGNERLYLSSIPLLLSQHPVDCRNWFKRKITLIFNIFYYIFTVPHRYYLDLCK